MPKASVNGLLLSAKGKPNPTNNTPYTKASCMEIKILYENDGCLISLFWIQSITYFMAIGRWFLTDHYSFWNGFKELVWELTPIPNVC